jgi:phage protein D
VTADLYYRVEIRAGPVSYDLSEDLTSLVVEEDGTRPDQLTIQMSDPFKVFSHALREGLEVEVDLGTVEDHSIIFRGHFYKVDGQFPADGVPSLRLVAYDRSMKMGLRRRNRVWTETTLSAIVSKIGGAYFRTPDIRTNFDGDPEFSGNGIRQQNETDLAFLYRLAARYGCEMFAMAEERTDSLRFVAQHRIMRSTPEVTLCHGRCGASRRLLRFEASSDVSRVRLPRRFPGMEYESGEAIQENAPVEEVADLDDAFADENLTAFHQRYPDRAPGLMGLLAQARSVDSSIREELGTAVLEETPGFTTPEELEARSRNQFSTSLLGMRGSGTAPGNHRLHGQAPVEIDDVGGRFSGTWYLAQVRHLLDSQGYRTEFQCQR